MNSVSVGISRNRKHIVVHEHGVGRPVYLTREEYDSYISKDPGWADVQLLVLKCAQELGWSK